ncbi:hypothetical protein DPMN_061396 [Dreissena polymorpha]|uniref:Uncharacterized protein n=1 Tax=Dreissena polymorpha TaxID=45954 RepID=A0A9D4C7Q3_DREPO|nr:hypothetical protein DPMN_061396 [Dreissena polymorpha]
MSMACNGNLACFTAAINDRTVGDWFLMNIAGMQYKHCGMQYKHCKAIERKN